MLLKISSEQLKEFFLINLKALKIVQFSCDITFEQIPSTNNKQGLLINGQPFPGITLWRWKSNDKKAKKTVRLKTQEKTLESN